MKDKLDKMLNKIEELLLIVGEMTDDKEEPEKPAKKKRGRPPKKAKQEQDFQVKQTQSKTPVVGKNKFEDILDLHVDRPEGYDNINDNVKRTPRTRKGFATVDMFCISCNKTFAVNPIFKKDNYVCDRCVAKKFGV